MTKVEIDGVVRFVPGSWDELAPRTFVDICQARKLTAPALRRMVITLLLLNGPGAGWWTRMRMRWTWHMGLGPRDRHNLLKLADPFIDLKAMRTTVLKRMPQRIGRGVPSYCTDWFDQMDAETWGVVDEYFGNYLKAASGQRSAVKGQPTPDDWLRYMVAVLYRRPVIFDYLRNADELQRTRLKHGSIDAANGVPSIWLQALAMQWSMLRMSWEKEAPHCFEKKSQGGNEKRPWMEVIQNLTNGRLADLPQLQRTPIRAVLREMNLRIVEAKNAKHRAEKHGQRA